MKKLELAKKLEKEAGLTRKKAKAIVNDHEKKY